MIAAHLAEERNLVTELSHPGSEDRGSTTERQLTFLREDLGTHQRRRPKTRRYDVDIQLTDDENLRSLQPTHLDPASGFQLISIKLLIAFECFWILI
jgi:hypothetical protein